MKQLFLTHQNEMENQKTKKKVHRKDSLFIFYFNIAAHIGYCSTQI